MSTFKAGPRRHVAVASMEDGGGSTTTTTTAPASSALDLLKRENELLKLALEGAITPEEAFSLTNSRIEKAATSAEDYWTPQVRSSACAASRVSGSRVQGSPLAPAGASRDPSSHDFDSGPL